MLKAWVRAFGEAIKLMDSECMRNCAAGNAGMGYSAECCAKDERWSPYTSDGSLEIGGGVGIVRPFKGGCAAGVSI
jgi:hypothetical protein